MSRIVELCSELGIDDLARQVYWWTGMSQANVLTLNSGTDCAEFVWVDRRPGLPGLLLSLGDFPLLARAIARGSIPPFDRIDCHKLRAWSKAPDREAWERTIDQLQQADEEYRRSQIDIIGHNYRLVTSSKLRRSIRVAMADYWRKTDTVDEATAQRVSGSCVRFALHLLLGCIPIIGQRLHKLAANSGYRAHVRRMLTDRKYVWAYFDNRRKTNLAMWLREGRSSEARAERCLDSFPAYFKDRLFSWLPPTWQRFFTDWAYAKDGLIRLVRNPYQYVFDVSHRRKVNMDWIHDRAEEDVLHGYVNEEEADKLRAVAGSDAMQQYITGIMVTAGVKPLSLILYAVMGIYGIKNFDQLSEMVKGFGWWAAPLAVALLLISPSGVLLFFYCLSKTLSRKAAPHGIAMVLAPIRAVGYLSFLVQITKVYPQFSGYLLTWSICHLVSAVPVFGERGGLLNIWAVAAFLSWPASLKAWRMERKSASA